MRPALEVADIFRRHGDAFRAAQHGRLLPDQRRVMAAIEACRTAALGGHVEQCDDCGMVRIAYNCCRDRHCPKCQGLARAQWLADRQADLLPVPYFHVVFTVPAPIAAIALQNKAVVYDILLKAAAETIRVIGADPQASRRRDRHDRHSAHLGPDPDPSSACPLRRAGRRPCARRTLGRLPAQLLPPGPRPVATVSASVPGTPAGGVRQRQSWTFFGNLVRLPEPAAFARHLAPLRHVEWIVYAKRPFGGPQQVLDYLGRYTHRVAIANSRLLACENGRVRFRWKDYRADNKSKVMTLDADEFIRRFLLHVLPKGFRRIRHFGFLANACRAAKLPAIRAALQAPEPAPTVEPADYRERYAILTGHRIDLCPICGGCMVEIGLWPRSPSPRRYSTAL